MSKAQRTKKTTFTLREVAEEASELTEGRKDPSTCSREIRNRIRRNFDDLAERWDGLDDAKENRDGNRYPPMTEDVKDELLSPYVS